MARDDRLKKVSGAGADFLETARAKAEDFLRELSKAGGDTQERAQGALDDLVEGGRKGTDQFVSAIRKEISNQLKALGLVTQDDLEALEKRLTGRVGAAESAARSATKVAATKAAAPAKKAPAAKKAAPSAAAGAPAKKAPAKKAPAAKKTAG